MKLPRNLYDKICACLANEEDPASGYETSFILEADGSERHLTPAEIEGSQKEEAFRILYLIHDWDQEEVQA